jgi:hypothetical protein
LVCIYILQPIGIFYGYLVFFTFLVCCTKKNLATLIIWARSKRLLPITSSTIFLLQNNAESSSLSHPFFKFSESWLIHLCVTLWLLIYWYESILKRFRKPRVNYIWDRSNQTNDSLYRGYFLLYNIESRTIEMWFRHFEPFFIRSLI